MTCRLCHRDRKLIEAHIIPKSFYRIDPKERQPSRLVTNVDGHYARTVPRGVYDPTIVCEECERRFSPWDDYADELFIKGWDSFEKLKNDDRDIGFNLSSYDYPRLKLFFVSLLWRAAVSSHEMFSIVDVGDHHEKQLQKTILQAEPGDLNHYGVVLQAFDATDVGILNPQIDLFDRVKFYRVNLSHIIAFIKVDARPLPHYFSDLALAPGKPLIIPQKNFLTSPERKIMKKLALAHMGKMSH